MIHIYYGFGKGKTSSAIGAGIRAYGSSMSVLLVSYFKDNSSSELNAIPFDRLEAPQVLPFNPGNDYIKWIDNSFLELKKSSYDMIILDEFLDLAPNYVDEETLYELVLNLECEVILTGHKRLDRLFEVADYITHFEKEKHPFDIGVKARRGIEY